MTTTQSAATRVVPVESPDAELRCARPARESGGFVELRRRLVNESVTEAIDHLRGDR